MTIGETEVPRRLLARSAGALESGANLLGRQIGGGAMISVRTACAASGTGSSFECWGDNTWGQLGANCAGTSCPFPVDVDGIDDGMGTSQGVTNIATSWGNVCVETFPTGILQCWGNDRAGQIGNGRGVDFFGDGGSGDQAFPKPDFVVTADGGMADGLSILGTGTHFCALRPVSRDFVCWGENSNGELGAPVGFYPAAFHAAVFDGAIRVELGDEHACMLNGLTGGYQIYCLGRAQFGQMGDGLPITNHLQETPAVVKFPSTPGGVAALRASE